MYFQTDADIYWYVGNSSKIRTFIFQLCLTKGSLQNIIPYILSFRQRGRGVRGQNWIVSKITKMSEFFSVPWEKNAHFYRLSRKGVGRWAAVLYLSRNDKIWAIFILQASLKNAIPSSLFGFETYVFFIDMKWGLRVWFLIGIPKRLPNVTAPPPWECSRDSVVYCFSMETVVLLFYVGMTFLKLPPFWQINVRRQVIDNNLQTSSFVSVRFRNFVLS